MRSNLHVFKVRLDVFDSNVMFAIGSAEKAARVIKRVHHLVDLPPLPRTTTLARCYKHTDYCPIIWFPCVTTSHLGIATLCHEAFHAVVDVLEGLSLRLCAENEEVFACAIDSVVEQALDSLNRRHKRLR